MPILLHFCNVAAPQEASVIRQKVVEQSYDNKRNSNNNDRNCPVKAGSLISLLREIRPYFEYTDDYGDWNEPH
jgi:hypothetical protein